MEGEILVLYRYNRPTITVRIQVSSSFDDFKSKLASKGVPTDQMSNLIFSIPEHAQCTLSTQEEWENMLMLLSLYGLRMVTITGENFVAQPFSNGVSGQIVPYVNTIVPVNNGQSVVPSSLLICQDTSHDLNAPFIDMPITDEKVLLSAHWALFINSVGQTFEGGVVEFRIKLAKYSLEKGYKYNFVRNSKKQVIAECAKRETHGCQWYVNATVVQLNGWFTIRTLNNEHTCPMELRSDKRLSATLISLLIVDKVKDDTTLGPKNVMNLIKHDYGLNVTYKQAWRGIEKAKALIFGSHIESYQELKWYLTNLKQVNPYSYIKFEEEPTPDKNGEIVIRFKRAFVCFSASIDGFAHCRPMLFLDGTFLSGRFKGTLLSATAKDGENGLFPFAFAIVTSENKENWKWFIHHLLNILPTGRDVIYVSDRNVGLMQLFKEDFRHLTHFYCLHHLKTNLRDRFNGRSYSLLFKEKAVSLLSECARAPTKGIFQQKLDELKKMGGNIVRDFLDGLPFERWAFAFAPCVRFGEMTSNAAESYNNWIKQARGQPICQCVDLIRAKLMVWFNERGTRSAEWSGVLCGGLQKKWDECLKESRSWHARRCSARVFEIQCEPTVVVDLDRRFCSCYGWQFHGFPCVHAVAAIHLSDSKVEDFVESYYYASTYRKCYEGIIMPVATIRKHTEITVLGEKVCPPVTVRQPGRPKNRIPSRGEPPQKKQYKCRRCNKTGHTTPRCKEPIS